jgi:glycosyltransferase involved in cell wall biosynthesis
VRIGIFGNTNNYPLRLALGLRKLGHDVLLVVNRKERLHRPESKYPQLSSGYPAWITDCSDIVEEEFIAATPRIGPVLDSLSPSDVLVLNDLGPSLLEFCPRPAMAFLTGSDLTSYANPGMRADRQRGWDPVFAQSPSAQLWTRRLDEFIVRQRNGIRQARAVSAPLPGLVPEIDALLHDIGVDAARRDFFYIANTDAAPPPPNRSNRRLRVVNGARLNWKKPMPPGFITLDHKGTDVLLEGFARFVASGGDAELVLFRKGLHVAETEALVAALGLGNCVHWRDETSLSDFYSELTNADIVCDQLGEAFPGMVAVDAMAIGLPVIANFRPDILGGYFSEPIAACQARTPVEVATHLATLAGSSRARIDAGRAARRFARRHLSPAAQAQRCLSHLGIAGGAVDPGGSGRREPASEIH